MGAAPVICIDFTTGSGYRPDLQLITADRIDNKRRGVWVSISAYLTSDSMVNT